MDIIQAAKYAQLSDFTHPRHEDESEISIEWFEATIKPTQYLAVFLVEFWVVECIGYRLFVFVDEYDDFFPRLFVCRFDATGKPNVNFSRSGLVETILFFPTPKVMVEYRNELAFCRYTPIEIEPQNGVRLPFSIEFIDCQSLKELSIARKILLHRRQEKRFSESARPRQKVVHSRIDEVVDVFRLIDVDIPTCAYIVKRFNSDGIFATH